jgi:hypothetical protein
MQRGTLIGLALTFGAACGGPQESAQMPHYKVTALEGSHIEAQILGEKGESRGTFAFDVERPVAELAARRALPQSWSVHYKTVPGDPGPVGPTNPGLDVDTCSRLEAECVDVCEDLPLPTQIIACVGACIAGYLICRQL